MHRTRTTQRPNQALLLAEVLDETGREAETARRALDETLERRDAERRAAEHRAAEENAARMQARVDAETERRRQATERRAAMIEAMRIDDTVELAPEPIVAEAVAEVAPVTTFPAPMRTTAALQVVRRGRRAFAAASAFVVALALGALTFFAVVRPTPIDTTTAYPTAMATTTSLLVAEQPVAVLSIPKAPVLAEAEVPEVEEERPHRHHRDPDPEEDVEETPVFRFDWDARPTAGH